MTLGEWIKNYRDTHSLSMQDMADMCGFSKAYIGQLEKGVNPSTGKPISPTIQAFDKIARAVGLDLDAFLKELDGTQLVTLLPDKKKEPTSYHAKFVNTFADRLNFLLTNAEMRPIDLSNATGIDKSSISRYLNGDYVPKQRRLTKIARALNADEGWLLTGVDQKRNIESFELSRKDEREIESDLEDMMNSISSAAYEGEDDIEDLEAFKATIKAAMIQAKKIAKKKYTPKKYRKDK